MPSGPVAEFESRFDSKISLITARDMTTLTSIRSDELIGAEEDQTFSGKLVKIKSRRDGVPLAEIQVGKLTEG